MCAKVVKLIHPAQLIARHQLLPVHLQIIGTAMTKPAVQMLVQSGVQVLVVLGHQDTAQVSRRHVLHTYATSPIIGTVKPRLNVKV
jgi:hypothetical protein